MFITYHLTFTLRDEKYSYERNFTCYYRQYFRCFSFHNIFYTELMDVIITFLHTKSQHLSSKDLHFASLCSFLHSQLMGVAYTTF